MGRSKEEVSVDCFPDDYFEAKYIGNTNKHFHHNSEYIIKITQDLFYRTYTISVIYNKTDETEMNYETAYSSKIDIRNQWEV